jgi:hypothetical protein
VVTSFFLEMPLRKRPVDDHKYSRLYAGLAPLPRDIRGQLWDRTRADGAFDESESDGFRTLYYRALSNAISSASSAPEVSGYLNVAAFSQYTSVAAVISMVILLLGIRQWTSFTIGILIAFVVSAVFLYFRFGRMYYRYMVRLSMLYLGSSPVKARYD